MSRPERMKKVLTADRLAALVFMLLVLLYGWDASKLTASLQGDVIGPTFFPKILTVLGIVLGVLLFLQGAPGKPEGASGESGSDFAALVPAVMLLVYVLSLEWLGFPLATVLFLAVAFRYLGHPGWPGAAGYSVVITGVVFVLFYFALGLKLPLGLFPRLF